jgi:molybdate transport repressor ModE-like protein
MKTREMALLSAINRTGSVTAAAQAVGMSQPAASAALRQLEDRLGYDLFSRERRRLSLTKSGRALLPEITNALAALDSVGKLAESMRPGKTRRLVVGTVPAAGASVLPEAVLALQKQERDLAVVLRAGTALEVVDMAAEQRIDLGVILGTAASEHVGYRLLAKPQLVCVMRADHPLARRKSISVADLARERYVSHARHLAIGALTAQHLEAAGFEFAPAIEVTQFSAACAFTEAGAGIAVVEALSGLYAQRHGLVTRPWKVESDLSLSLVWPLSQGLGRSAKKLADTLAANVQGLMA